MERKSQFLVIAKRTVKGIEESKKILLSAHTKYHALELAMIKEPHYQTYEHKNIIRKKY